MAGIPGDPYASGRGSIEDLLRDQDLSTGPDPQAFLQNLLALQPLRQGITNEVDMGPDPYEGDPNRYEQWDPNESYQVAGDVVRGPLPKTPEDLNNALRTFTGSGGMQTINRLGGVKNPYLDLLDILAYPQGGQIRK